MLRKKQETSMGYASSLWKNGQINQQYTILQEQNISHSKEQDTWVTSHKHVGEKSTKFWSMHKKLITILSTFGGKNNISQHHNIDQLQKKKLFCLCLPLTSTKFYRISHSTLLPPFFYIIKSIIFTTSCSWTSFYNVLNC